MRTRCLGDGRHIHRRRGRLRCLVAVTRSIPCSSFSCSSFPSDRSLSLTNRYKKPPLAHLPNSQVSPPATSKHQAAHQHSSPSLTPSLSATAAGEGERNLGQAPCEPTAGRAATPCSRRGSSPRTAASAITCSNPWARRRSSATRRGAIDHH